MTAAYMRCQMLIPHLKGERHRVMALIALMVVASSCWLQSSPAVEAMALINGVQPLDVSASHGTKHIVALQHHSCDHAACKLDMA